MMNLPLVITGLINFPQHFLHWDIRRTIKILQLLLLEPIPILVSDEDYFVGVAEGIDYIFLFYTLCTGYFTTAFQKGFLRGGEGGFGGVAWQFHAWGFSEFHDCGGEWKIWVLIILYIILIGRIFYWFRTTLPFNYY